MLSVIREMQIKQQWGIISVKMAIIEKTRDNKCCWECWERESLGYSMEVSPEIKGRTNMTQQFHFWEENETNNLKTYMYSNSYSQIIYNSQDMKKTLVSINGWIKQTLTFNTYIMQYYSATREDILPFVKTWMVLAHYAEMSDRKRQVLCVITYVWKF